jgi:hypothetical protein
LGSVRICHDSLFAANANINAALEMHADNSQAGNLAGNLARNPSNP